MKIEWSFAINQPWTIDHALNFVTLANRYHCSIYVGKNGKMLNAKGLLGVISFSLSLGDRPHVDLQLDGVDADAAFEQLSQYLREQEPTPTIPYLRNH